MTPKTFLASKNNPKVDDLSYEPDNSSKEINPETGHEFEVGSIYWVYLATGWYHDDEGKHLVTGSNLADIHEQMREIQPCECDQCLSQKEQNKDTP